MGIKNYVADTRKYSPIYKEWIYFLKKEKKLGAWLKDNAIVLESDNYMHIYSMSVFTNKAYGCVSYFKASHPLIPYSKGQTHTLLLTASNDKEFEDYFSMFLMSVHSHYWKICNYTLSNTDWQDLRTRFLYERQRARLTMIRAKERVVKGRAKEDRNEKLKWFDTIGRRQRNRWNYNFIRR